MPGCCFKRVTRQWSLSHEPKKTTVRLWAHWDLTWFNPEWILLWGSLQFTEAMSNPGLACAELRKVDTFCCPEAVEDKTELGMAAVYCAESDMEIELSWVHSLPVDVFWRHPQVKAALPFILDEVGWSPKTVGWYGQHFPKMIEKSKFHWNRKIRFVSAPETVLVPTCFSSILVTAFSYLGNFMDLSSPCQTTVRFSDASADCASLTDEKGCLKGKDRPLKSSTWVCSEWCSVSKWIATRENLRSQIGKGSIVNHP